VAPGTKRAAVSSVSMRVTDSQIAAAQTMLDAVFPAELREIYLPSDGVFDRSGQWFVIWPLTEI
jgi:hypothetical protein